MVCILTDEGMADDHFWNAPNLPTDCWRCFQSSDILIPKEHSDGAPVFLSAKTLTAEGFDVNSLPGGAVVT